MAGLTFAIQKRRRAEGGFPGAVRILAEIETARRPKRVGFDVDGRQPVREGALESSTATAMKSARSPAAASRRRCSGRSPWAMSPTHLAEPGTALKLEQRGKLFDARVAPCRSSPTAITAREPDP
jgi:aminomethyltransferase